MRHGKNFLENLLTKQKCLNIILGGMWNKMDINLVKATLENANELFQMQIITFKPLLEKYQDFDLNPGNEKIERTIARLNEEITDYIIKTNKNSVGGIRIRRYEEGALCCVGPLFILPEYQNKGMAQKVFRIIEKKYKPKTGGYWIRYYRKKEIVIYMKK
jgi:hypothetical protein